MTNQLTVRIDVENSTAVVSRPSAVRSRTLAVAAAAGSQVLAFTAAADHHPEHHSIITNPIVYPESVYALVMGLGVGVLVGFAAGVILTRAYTALSRK